MGKIHDRFKHKARASAAVAQDVRACVDDLIATRSLKGTYRGNCNRTACQMPGAVFWNRGSHSWYCAGCARMLNRENARWVQQDLGVDVLCVDRGIYTTDDPALELYEFQTDQLHTRGVPL